MPRTKGNSTSNESKGPSDAGVKKSRSAKKIFMDHERKKLTGDVNEKEFKKNFTSKWKEMSKEEKKVLLLNVPADVYQKFFELQKAEKGTAASTKSKESKKSKKSKKDPNAPKKAQSGYNFYMKENMHLVKQEKPDISHKEVMSLVSARWKKVDDEEKKKYNALAEADKKRYQDEKAEYEKQKTTEE